MGGGGGLCIKVSGVNVKVCCMQTEDIVQSLFCYLSGSTELHTFFLNTLFDDLTSSGDYVLDPPKTATATVKVSLFSWFPPRCRL